MMFIELEEAMKSKDFIRNLPIKRTREGRGRGVSLNCTFYVYRDGHGNLSCSTGNKAVLNFPSNDSLETVAVVANILRKMQVKARRI